MFVDVFRSRRNSDTYLYMPRGAAFADLPEALQQVFGSPELALSLNLESGRQLARYSSDEILAELKAQGFFLQMPPAERSEDSIC